MTREKLVAMKRGAGGGNACPSYVHSRITLYHASKIDLRYCRSLHSCAGCRLGLMEECPCGAVHYGICAAVASPSSKLRKGSSASSPASSSSPSTPSSPVPSSPASPSGKGSASSGVYYSSASITSTGRRDGPKSRSLAILREGHELAPWSGAFQSGLVRLQPQRHVIVHGGGVRIGGHPGPEVVAAAAPRGGAGGVAITFQRGQTNITSSGNTDIKIQGQGHEIHIQGSGGQQNIRVHPAVNAAGGRTGHVIRIQGQGHGGNVQYQGAGPDRLVQTIADLTDSGAPVAQFPAPKSYSSTKQIVSQKPTARVAPAPVPTQTIAPAQTFLSIPESLPCSPPPLILPPPLSPNSGCPTPPFPVSPPATSLAGTPGTSPPVSPSPGVNAPVATVTPTAAKQPVLSVSNKDKEVSNHVGVTPPPPTSNPEVIKRPSKEISVPVNGDSLLNTGLDIYPNNRKSAGKDEEVPYPPTPNARLLLQRESSDIKGGQPQKVPGGDNNKENRQKKHGQRGSKPAYNVNIPQFYFPSGKPGAGPEMEVILQRVAQEFSGLEAGKAYKQQMAAVTKACGFPLYWKILLFRAAGGTKDGFITYQSLSALLKKLFQTCHDDASKFIKMAVKSQASSLDFEDFEPLIQDVVETHPGLTFLQDAPEFHSRYVTTVISRIYFCVNRSWSGRITLPELRKSNFLQTLGRLEEEEDINQIKDYFSYEHFYVIYCKFWELDKDHDLYIDKNDLSRHNDHALNSRLIDRIFSGAVTRGPDFQEGKMSYKEFVWFLLAEEDKRHPTSIEYWFRCMDLDGDGFISMYEMEYFHEEQMNKMETLGIERLPFEDTVCQMIDMVCPKIEGKITLGDLKACKMTNIFFDTFFNLDKFLEHEQRDPFANARDPNSEPTEDSDWNRYAEEEYNILVADEGNADMDDGNYEDDFEPDDDDEILREEMLRLADSNIPSRTITPGQSHTAEDLYDFSSTNLGY